MAGSQLQGPRHQRQRAGGHQRHLHLPGHILNRYPGVLPHEANAAGYRRHNDIYRLRLHNRIDRCRPPGKSIIRLGPPYLGRSGTRHPTGCHSGLCREAGFRLRVLLHEIVSDFLVLPLDPGKHRQVVQMVHPFWTFLQPRGLCQPDICRCVRLHVSCGLVITCEAIQLTLSLSPVRKYWTFPEVVDGTCLDEGVITMAAGVMSCMADLLCTLLPVPIIMRLHMPLRDRIGVIVLLSAGIIVTIAGVLRTVFIWQALVTTYDESWHTYPLWICAAVEIDLAVVCCFHTSAVKDIELTELSDLRMRTSYEDRIVETVPALDGRDLLSILITPRHKARQEQ